MISLSKEIVTHLFKKKNFGRASDAWAWYSTNKVNMFWLNGILFCRSKLRTLLWHTIQFFQWPRISLSILNCLQCTTCLPCTPPQKLTSSSYRQKRENDKYRWKCICSIIGLQHARSKVEWHCPLTPSFVAVLWWCPLLVLGTVLWCCLLIYPVLDGVLWCCACHCQLSLTLSACSKSPSASVTAWRFTSIVCQVWEALCCHGNTSNAVKGCKYFLEKLSSALLPFSRHPLQFLLPWL